MNICEYGCGQEANHQFKNGKWCCSNNTARCPSNREKNSKSQQGKHIGLPIKTTELCSYGCGQVAKYKLKNGKLCCNNHYSKCPISRKKNSNSQKVISIETTELCSYGCGQIAKYKFGNDRLCCSNHYSKCPINSKKLSDGQKSTPIETTELCSYGCGQQAKYKLKNGKLCCNDSINKCPINRKKNSDSKKVVPIEITELCSYGCGQIAKFEFKNGKLCCSDNLNKCPINKEKIKINMKAEPIETTELCSYGCGQIAKFKLKNGKLCCEDHYNKCPSFKLTINQIKERYPTFYKIENLRYNPNKPNKKEIQVRCKNHKCKNSKEQDGWFTPIQKQLSERIDCIEKPWGNDGGYFYCSDKCKDECILFNLRSDPLKDTTSPHTPVELNIWRQEVLKRQKAEYNINYNFCEMCNSRKNLDVHHEKPQKTHPGMTLDPDNGIILCKDCHYGIGHKKGTECSTGNLANYNPCN